MLFGSLRVHVRWNNWEDQIIIRNHTNIFSDGNWHSISVHLNKTVCCMIYIHLMFVIVITIFCWKLFCS